MYDIHMQNISVKFTVKVEYVKSIYSSLMWSTLRDWQAVFHYCYPDCPSCLAYLNSIGLATWAVWAAIKKQNLNFQACICREVRTDLP